MVIEGGNGPNRRGAQRPPRRGPRVEQPQTVLRLPEDPYAADYPARAGRGRGLVYLVIITAVVASIIAIASSKSKPSSQTAGSAGTAGVGGGVSAPPTGVQSPPGQQSAGTAVNSDVPQQFDDTRFPGLNSNGVLIGYPDTNVGAEAAAANYVAAFGSEVMWNTTKRHALIKTIADPAIEQNLQTQFDTAFTTAAHAYNVDAQGNPPAGQVLVYRNIVVGVKVQSYAAKKATVAVWADTLDGLAGASSTNPVTDTWSTITINLVWVNGDWKSNSYTQVDGPTPASDQQASAPAAFLQTVTQFVRLRYAP